MEPSELAAPLARLAGRWPGVRLVVLFGSLARRSGRPDSDADVGVLGGGFWEQLDVGTEVGGLMEREPHVVSLETASDWLRFEIARDGLLLHEREPATWTSFRAESALRYFDLAPMVTRCAEGVRRRLAREAEARRA